MKGISVERILNNSATSLVASILTNLEILEKNNKLIPDLYKPIIKETIYSQFKYLVKLLANPEVRFERKGGNNE